MTLSGTAGITFLFLVDIANLFWISKLDEIQLIAAMGFAFAIQYFSVSFGLGLMIAATALVSRSIGQGCCQEARQQASSTMAISIFVQCAVASLFLFFCGDLVALIGAEGETARLTERYLKITLPSLPLMAIGMIGSAILRAEGDALRAMFVTLGSGFVAMLVDPILIIWLDLRLDGAGMAVWVSRICMASLALWFVIGKHNLLARPSPTHIRATVKPFSMIAGPTILTQLATPFGSYLLTTVVAGFGDSAVAAWALINRLTVLAFGGIFSLSGAVGGIFGQNLGAQRYDRLRSTYRDAVIFCIGYPTILWVVLMMVNDLIANAFGLDGQGSQILEAFTHVGAAAFVFTGMMFVATAAFNNLGRPIYSTALNWTREGVVTLPLAIWLASAFAAPGVIYAQAVVAFVLGILATAWGFSFILSEPGKQPVSTDTKSTA
jgi:putative MATE family efflux protein